MVAAWTLATLLVTGGCANVPNLSSPAPRWLPAGTAWLSGETDRLLFYHEFLRKLDAAQLTSEANRTRDEFARSQGDSDRLRLAMLLSLPQAAVANPAQAQLLLEPLLAPGGEHNEGLVRLARLMYDSLGEQRRLEGQASAASQRLRDERRRAESAEQLYVSNLQSAQQKLKAEQSRADALEKKLQELRLIEKSMSDRPRPKPRSP